MRWSVRIALALVSLGLGCGVALGIESDTTLNAELPVQTGNVRMIGVASPGSLVTFVRGGAVIGTQLADANSFFDKSFSNQPPGLATYSVYATDTSNRQTDVENFDVTVPSVFTATVNDIVLPSTFRVASSPIKRPAVQSTFGSAANGSTVTTFYSGARYSDSFARQALAASDGSWNVTAGQTLHLGDYTVNSVVQTSDNHQSPQSTSQTFQVLLSADLNNDGVINLADFSALMFSYNVPPPGFTRPADINDDNFVNLADFSVMMFYYGR
ncbi:MAG TPA: hypothetical protein VLF41_01985 [Candidatus Nanoarchaeia archaeon]|nr:hypothetical protein [Candidatus Nanoarchaeia archaeon]